MDDEPRRQPFWGSNAKPFFLQAAVVIILALTLGRLVGGTISEAMCEHLDICSREQQQRLRE